jgi:7,8-dihydroneopterin aldolase/epimerase/oxygenase
LKHGTLRRSVEAAMLRTKRALIEAVAEDIARDVLQFHGRAQSVQVSVSKPHVAIAGHFDSMGVEIFRQRS